MSKETRPNRKVSVGERILWGVMAALSLFLFMDLLNLKVPFGVLHIVTLGGTILGMRGAAKEMKN
jgi:hypothetical protein